MRATGNATTGARPELRREFFLGIVALTTGSLVLAAVLAPRSRATEPATLAWLLIAGYAGHVAGTTWLGTFEEVRAQARRRPDRFLVAPAVVLAMAVTTTVAVPTHLMPWLLLAYFTWQFLHFQKQNLGLVALAGSAYHAPPLRARERRVIMAAAGCGIVGLLAHPSLLDLPIPDGPGWLFPLAGWAMVTTGLAGVAILWHRPADDRPWPFVAVYGTALVFFVPVFVGGSPFAAVAGMVVAHGLQYLWLLRSMARGGQRPRPSAATLAVVVLVGGVVLNALSERHQSGGLWSRGLFGIYLGVVMAHFVVDGGLWHLRDAAARRFVAGRLPFAFPATGPEPGPR